MWGEFVVVASGIQSVAWSIRCLKRDSANTNSEWVGSDGRRGFGPEFFFSFCSVSRGGPELVMEMGEESWSNSVLAILRRRAKTKVIRRPVTARPASMDVGITSLKEDFGRRSAFSERFCTVPYRLERVILQIL